MRVSLASKYPPHPLSMHRVWACAVCIALGLRIGVQLIDSLHDGARVLSSDAFCVHQYLARIRHNCAFEGREVYDKLDKNDLMD
jgi:hypothetical protein